MWKIFLVPMILKLKMNNMKHEPLCRWQTTSPSICDYRLTHEYCPHQEHLCTCLSMPGRERSGFELDNGTSGTPASTHYIEDLEIKIDDIENEYQKSPVEIVRDWIEKEEKYVAIARERLKSVTQKLL